MTCISCEAELETGNRYCDKCGIEQTRSAEQNAPTTPVSEEQSQLISVTTGSVVATPVTPTLSVAELEKLHARLTHANLFRMNKKWDEAIEECVQVLQAQPGNATAHSLLGDIYAGQGKMDDAIQWYRMAIELKPNASDTLKMKKLEAERDRLVVGSLRRGGGALLAADGGAMAGTTNLVGGITPRRWLNVLTGVALAFVGTTVLALVVVQFRHNHPPVQQAKAQIGGLNDLSRFQNQSQNLPPVSSLSGGSVNRGSVTNNTGSGFPADRPNGSTTMTPAPTAPPTNDGGYRGTPAPGSAPAANGNAPTYKTSPLPNIPPPNGQTNGQSGNSTSGGSIGQHNVDSTQLPGGMYIASVRPDLNLGTANVQIVASNWRDSESSRRVAVQNALRAAHSVFVADQKISQVSLMLSSEGGADGNTGVLQAEINRNSINGINIEGMSQEQAEKLTSIRWLIQSSRPATNESYGSIEIGK